MNRSISIEAFNDIERFKKELKWVKDAGFKTVDISFWRNVCLKDDREDYAKAIREELDRQGMKCGQTHLTCYDFYKSSEIIDEETERALNNGVVLSSILGAPWAIYHPRTSLTTNFSSEAALHDNREALKPLLETGSKGGVGICVEYIPVFPDCPRFRWYASDPDDLCELVDSFNCDNISVCWDTSHANLMSFNQPKVIRQMGKRIKTTHLGSNYKEQDWHLLPLFGYIDMESIMEAFKDIGYDGNINLEVTNVMERARATYYKLCYESCTILKEMFDGTFENTF